MRDFTEDVIFCGSVSKEGRVEGNEYGEIYTSFQLFAHLCHCSTSYDDIITSERLQRHHKTSTKYLVWYHDAYRSTKSL